MTKFEYMCELEKALNTLISIHSKLGGKHDNAETRTLRDKVTNEIHDYVAIR